MRRGMHSWCFSSARRQGRVNEKSGSAGHLCAKGAASQELVTHPNELARVNYSPALPAARGGARCENHNGRNHGIVYGPRASAASVEQQDGKPLMQVKTIRAGGATLDNERSFT